MKTISQTNTKPKYAKAYEWGKLIALTGGAQSVVQATGLISGILVIRLLPTQEYALYTLANTMLGTMTVLADGGISAGVMAEGGKVWQDREKLGVVLATGLDLRKKFAVGSLLVSVPILFYLLMHHGASALTSLLIVLSLVPAFLAALSDTLLQIAPKLRQDIKPLQSNQVGVNIGRLVILGLTAFVFPWAFIAVLAGGVPRIWGNLRLQKISANYADSKQLPDPKIRKKILAYAKRIMPGAVYYCISGQITIWLISIFGTTASVAQIGALGRITMALTLIGTLFSTLVIPRFARLAEDKQILLSRFIQIQVSIFAICIVVVGLVTLFPSQVLWILGKEYANLTNEVVLITIGSSLSLISGITFGLSTSRGLILPPVVNIFGNILIQLTLITILDLSTTKGVLTFSIVNSTSAFCMLLIYYIFRVSQIKIAKL